MLQPPADDQRTEDGRTPQAAAPLRRAGATQILRTLAAIVLAPVLPPVSVFVACGRSRHFYVSLVLAVFAYGVFQFLFAGPGLILWGLGIVYAVACAVQAVWPRRALVAAEQTPLN
ncbi:MAG TPA: YqaE/Pmp3 family membrane protein [Methylomirabilota bacterium]|nr:YqaE/Pmp3 family membrane protein [Methylomirabilota bacterium]